MTPTKQTTEQALRDDPGAPVALHEISGKTPDELWLECGRLGAKLADSERTFAELNSLCTEHGIPQGAIGWRLDVMLGMLDDVDINNKQDAQIRRLSQALREIHEISQGSATANSLQHLAQIASDALGY